MDDTIGSSLYKTTNSLTTPGEVYLIGTKEALENAYKTIRSIEEKLYQQVILPADNTLKIGLFQSANQNKFDIKMISDSELQQTIS